MKPFNLEEYLKNPSKKVVTRMGRKVRIICTDREDSTYPVVALVKDDNRKLDVLVAYIKGGIPAEYNEEYYTLFFVPEKHEGWTNVYEEGTNRYLDGCICSTEEEAKRIRGYGYITTIKIEWEE